MRHYFVTNIQKHGNACVINLHSWYTQESVILELNDDGKGNVIIVLVNTLLVVSQKVALKEPASQEAS